jgi:GT2 family glycosyltransferase
MKISVLIPSWRRPDSLARCIDGLEAQERRPDELVLAIRADDAETREMLAGRRPPFPLEIATPGAPGLLAALNTGFDRVTGEIVVATDDDTVAHPDWLARIERRFEADPRLGGLGGPDRMVLQADQPLVSADTGVGRVRWFGRVVGNHHVGAGEMRDVDLLKGANMAFRTSALGDRRIDTALRGGGTQQHTEIDLCLGLRRDGWTLAFDPAVRVDHYEEPRHGGERENQMSAAEHHNAIHNQTYALLKNLPPLKRLVTFSYGLLVGTRDNPGLLLAIERVLSRRPSASKSSSLRVNSSARLSALKSWWRRRRSVA